MYSSIKNLIKRIIPEFPYFFSFVLKFYFSGLFVFALLRLFLLVYTKDQGVLLFNETTFQSFIVGIRFDTLVLSYLLLLPLILLFIHSFFQFKKKHLTLFITLFLCIFSSVVLFLTIADIPYSKFFRNRISADSFQWLNDIPVVFQMIIKNPVNLFFLVFALSAIVLLCIFIYKKLNKSLIKFDWQSEYSRHGKLTFSVYFLCLAFFCFLGMRGMLSRPIRQEDAFYCNNPVLNQIGLNPIFTLGKSLDDQVGLMDENEAIKQTQEYLQITSTSDSISPVTRIIKSDSVMKKFNIILVLMEGLSADYMGTFGDTNHLTPTLDSLSRVSYFFKNTYSAGIHTNNGIFSTLYSFPALRRVRPMSNTPVHTYSGLPYTLKMNGYKNLFFCPHGKSFDNIGGFIPANYFDELYSAELYPAEKLVGPFGVPDDYLFHYAIDRINKLNPCQPFFTTILTASNHDPYVLPDYFKSSINDNALKAVSYADWSIHQFLEEAKKCNWFERTIFVFLSDHGRLVGQNPYDMAISYNHIPLMIYAPTILGEPKVIENFTGQMDVFPTLMGLLNASYINNTLGIDVLKEKRECIYFSADDKLGCIDNNLLYIYRYGGAEGLYRYKTGKTENIASSNKNELEQLKRYAYAQTQAAESIIAKDLTSIKSKLHE